MPELPEVETVRRALAPVLEGRRLDRVRIDDVRLTLPLDPAGVARRLKGERVAQVDRRGKYLMLRFESGRVLLVHLRMTGSFRHADDGKLELDAYRRAVVQLDDGSRARLPRPAALRHLAPARAGRGRAVPGRPARPRAFRRRFHAARARGAAREQARAPSRPRSSTSARSRAWGTSTPTRRSGARASTRCARRGASTPPRCAALHRAIRRALEIGIARQGSTLSDYRQPNGAAGRDAGRVQGLRPRRRAVRPLRDADRAHRRRRPRHVVLPPCQVYAASSSSSRPSRSRRTSSV